MNRNLKIALLDKGVPQYRTAMEADVQPTKLSQIIYGGAKPSDEEKERLARVLGCEVDHLFPAENLK